MNEQCWRLENGECLEHPPEDYYGYVYLIIDDKGRKYIGKKAFTHRVKTKLSKKARAGTRKRVKVVNKDSGWQEYWGSCKPLLAYIKERGSTKHFTRIILKFCKTRQDLTYWELVCLVQNNVLFDETYWNSNILSRFFKGKINQ